MKNRKGNFFATIQQNKAIKITLLYILIGFLWILLSDRIVFAFNPNPETLTIIQNIKGWFYVVATGLLLYYLIKSNIQKIKTEMEEKEQFREYFYQSQKMETIGQLSAQITHDINNVINIIQANAEFGIDELSKDPIKTQELVENFQEIQYAIEQMKNLTNVLLGYGRKSLVKKEEINMNQLLQKTVKMIQRLFGNSYTIELKTEENLETINVRSHQIEQIILNLALNARDAIAEKIHLDPQTSRIIYISCSIHEFKTDYQLNQDLILAGKYIHITLMDQGIGMQEETKKNLFKPFFTTKSAGKGTGLGLVMIKGILQEYQAFISVTSTYLEGTKFDIFWPI